MRNNLIDGVILVFLAVIFYAVWNDRADNGVTDSITVCMDDYGCVTLTGDARFKAYKYLRPNDGPIDGTGHDSIVLDYDESGWCELRGPGRFEALADIECTNSCVD